MMTTYQDVKTDVSREYLENPLHPLAPRPMTLDPRPSTLDFNFCFNSLFIKFGKQYQVNIMLAHRLQRWSNIG